MACDFFFLLEKAGVYQPWVGVGFLSRIMGFYPKSLDRYKSNQYFYSDYEAENQDTGEYLYDSFDYVFDEPYVAINEYRCWYCW